MFSTFPFVLSLRQLYVILQNIFSTPLSLSFLLSITLHLSCFSPFVNGFLPSFLSPCSVFFWTSKLVVRKCTGIFCNLSFLILQLLFRDTLEIHLSQMDLKATSHCLSIIDHQSLCQIRNVRRLIQSDFLSSTSLKTREMAVACVSG